MMSVKTSTSNPSSALLPVTALQAPQAIAQGEAGSGQPSFARLLQDKQAPAPVPVQPHPPAPAPASTRAHPPAPTAPAEPHPAGTASVPHAPPPPPARPAAPAREAARGRDGAGRAAPSPAGPAKAAPPSDQTAAKATDTDADDTTTEADPALADWLAHLNLPAAALPATPVLAGTAATDTPAPQADDPAATPAGQASLAGLGLGTSPPADGAKAGADAARGARGDTTVRGAGRDAADPALFHAGAKAEAQGSGQPGSGDAGNGSAGRPVWTPVTLAGLDAAAPLAAWQAGPLTPAAPAASAAAAPTAVTLPTPVHAPEFPQALGVQLAVLARGGVEQAELHLNPADMGPVSVQIAIDGNQARIDFGADVAATRQAIESGLPELASALRDAGLTLTGGGVSQHSRGRDDTTDAQAGRHPRGHALSDGGTDLVGNPTTPLRRVVRAGGVDMYA